jgi:hypothetical protein
MKNYVKYYLIICCAILFSCNDSRNTDITGYNTETVSFDLDNTDEINITELIDSVRFIKLETVDESLIAEITQIVFHEGLYFIRDRKSSSIFVFDRTGKYKFRISQRGSGPGEYVTLSRMLIDKKNRQILIYDAHMSKMIYYTFEGKHIKDAHNFCDKAIIRDLILLSDGSFLCYNFYYEEGLKYWGIWKVDSSGKFDKYIFKQTTIYPPVVHNDMQYFYELSNSEIGLWRSDIDDILHFSNDSIIYGLSMKINKTTVADFPGITKYEDLPSHFTGKTDVIEKDNFILTTWWDHSKTYADRQTVFFKKEKKSLVILAIDYRTDMAVFAGQSAHINCTDQMLDIIEAHTVEDMIEYFNYSDENKALLRSMFQNEDDNPVLQILYLKK